MPPNLLPLVVTSIRTRIEEGFWLKSERSGLLAAAIGCLTLALSTSPSSAQIRNMLCDEARENATDTSTVSYGYPKMLTIFIPLLVDESLFFAHFMCFEVPTLVPPGGVVLNVKDEREREPVIQTAALAPLVDVLKLQGGLEYQAS
ncbi:hypothetical protein V8G54_000909 [Vigna mungo]|uniref:Uncharacterized protein n=1 Tax=Vigna mungo TaxID=3915 RepID=A0AAQ3P651_VIGMU